MDVFRKSTKTKLRIFQMCDNHAVPTLIFLIIKRIERIFMHCINIMNIEI